MFLWFHISDISFWICDFCYSWVGRRFFLFQTYFDLLLVVFDFEFTVERIIAPDATGPPRPTSEAEAMKECEDQDVDYWEPTHTR